MASEVDTPRPGLQAIATAISAFRCAKNAFLRHMHLGHRFTCHRLEHEFVRVAIHIDSHVGAIQHLTVKNLQRQRVLDHAL